MPHKKKQDKYRASQLQQLPEKFYFGAQTHHMIKHISFLLATGLFFYPSSPMAQQKQTGVVVYPVTKVDGPTETFFGTQVQDPYRWLEDDNSAETAHWVKEQNKTADGYLSKIPYRTAIKKRLTDLWNYEKFSLPEKAGDYLYFFKNDGLQNQSVLYRQKGNAAPEIFLDPNTFSADGTTSIAGIDYSKDGSLAAYLISEGGSDWQKIVIINTATKQQVGDTLQNVKFSWLGWKGNEGLYYSSYDRPTAGNALSARTEHHKLFYHKLGTPQKEDKLVLGGAATPRRYVFARVSEDEQTLVVYAQQNTYGTELYLQDLTRADAPLVPAVNNFNNEHQYLYSEGDIIYLSTDLDAPNKRVVMFNRNNPSPQNWKDLIPQKEYPMEATVSGRKLFASYLKDAISEVVQYDLQGKKENTIALPGPGSVYGFSGKKEETETYYIFTSYTYPSTVFKYNSSTKASTVYKKPNIKFDPSLYESKQVFYTSKDGTKVPMIITYKKGTVLNGKNPLMLYGYGGFNVNLTPAFSTSNILLLENGGIYAVPNIRGGGEYGKAWHAAGTKLQKQNVFDDFIAAAEYLVQNKYTSKEYLAISGGSNGGLLVGACMTQRPDLFKVAFPSVGVLDMLRYHKFTSGAGWANDYGTAEDNKEMFEYLLKYSPLHNLKVGTCYPATLVSTGDHDDRVVPAHSFKFAAALQAAQNCDKPVLISIQTKAGHGAGKPISMVIEELADKWAFMFYNMQYQPPQFQETKKAF